MGSNSEFQLISVLPASNSLLSGCSGQYWVAQSQA